MMCLTRKNPQKLAFLAFLFFTLSCKGVSTDGPAAPLAGASTAIVPGMELLLPDPQVRNDSLAQSFQAQATVPQVSCMSVALQANLANASLLGNSDIVTLQVVSDWYGAPRLSSVLSEGTLMVSKIATNGSNFYHFTLDRPVDLTYQGVYWLVLSDGFSSAAVTSVSWLGSSQAGVSGIQAKYGINGSWTSIVNASSRRVLAFKTDCS